MENLTETFIFLTVKFFIFYCLLFLIGRSFVLIINKDKKIDNKKILNLDSQIIYPIFGLIFVGNFLVFFNFFFPIKSNLTYLFFLIILINIKYPLNFNIFKKTIAKFPIYITLLISSSNVYFHYDAGLYHLNNQMLLRENNIILGISNIYGPFGVGSIYEYISSFLWLDRSYVLLHFLSLIFIGFFFEIIYDLIFNNEINYLKNIGISLLIFSIFDNFGYSGGRNGLIYIQGIGKQDVAVAVLFVITAVLIIYNVKNKKFDSFNFLIVSYLSLFIYQLKVSGVMIFSFYIFYVVHLIKEDKLQKIKFSDFLLFSTIGIFWLLKSLLNTGCLIFPLAASCFDQFSWSNEQNIKVIQDISIGYSNSYNFGDSLVNWFKDYIEINMNFTILLNYTISYLIIAFVVFSKTTINNSKVRNKNFPIRTILFLNILFYLNFGPDPRYIMAIQILLIALIGFNRFPRVNFSKQFLQFLFIIAVVSFVRLDSYRNFDFFNHPNYTIPEPEVSKLYDRSFPKDGDQCWANIECSPNRDNFTITKSKYFKIVNLDN